MTMTSELAGIQNRLDFKMPMSFIERQLEKIHKFFAITKDTNAKIYALIPAYERESELDKTIESLLLQTRQIDRILIVVNGPGIRNTAMDTATTYAKMFPNIGVVRTKVSGKVNALNMGYKIIQKIGEADFVLGVDADIQADKDMVKNLEHDLNEWPNALGVRARYGFKRPEDSTNASMSLVNGQRVEFAMTEIKAQLRGYRTTILGGQATLFKMPALQSIAEVMPNRAPWDATSKVEDAQLTRTGSMLGFDARVSPKAGAWTGLMLHPHQWHSQRRKWQDGHLDDLTKEFHPVKDARRWGQQFLLFWNILIRMFFVSLAGASILTNMWVFNPIWLVPIGLSVMQTLLITIKIPDRSLGEIIRALLFIPGEIYYLRTLSIWIESITILLLNIHADGWKAQYKAESSKRKANVSGWMVIALAMALPMLALIALIRFDYGIGAMTIRIGWNALTIMTIISIIDMTWLIARIIRKYAELRP